MPSNGILPPVRRNRKQRIQKLKNWIDGRRDEFPSIEALIAKFMLDEGVSLRKVREYLKILMLAGEIDETVKI